MACVNKSLPGYKELASQFGDGLAESLVVNNNYEIPTIEQAVNIIRGNKIQQFTAASNYLQNTQSGDPDALVQNFGKILQQVGSDVYVVKGSKNSIPAAPLATSEIRNRNIKFLEALNQRIGPLFTILKNNVNKLFNAPNPETAVIANQYKIANGIPIVERPNIYSVDVERAKSIADAYEAMPHAPNDPVVRQAYQNMADETIKQYNAIVAAGYTAELYQGEGEPYANSADMLADVINNKHLFVLPTDSAFGQDDNTTPTGYLGQIEPISDGNETQTGMSQDIKMRDAATGFIGEVRRQNSSSYHSAENIAGKTGGEVVWNSTNGTTSVLNDNTKVVMLARNFEYQNTPLDEETKALMLEAKNAGRQFVVGDMATVDNFLVDYLDEIGATYILYHTEGNERMRPEKAVELPNPLLEDSGVVDVNNRPMLVNDVFRFVHDFFGHTERGNGFGPIGEENAWDVHAQMYSPLARRAMTAETRGQNSWVNFGPHMRNQDGSIKKKGDEGYLSPTERPFAEQKMGLLPEQFSNTTNAETTSVTIANRKINSQTTAQQFHTALSKVIKRRPFDGSQLALNSIDYYQNIVDNGGYLFLSEDSAIGGYVTNDGYVGSIFKDPTVKEGITKDFLELARANGGKYLDSYSSISKLYESAGFVPVAKMPFDESLANPGWESSSLSSKPDVLFYSYAPNVSDVIPINVNTYEAGIQRAANYVSENNIKDTEDNNIPLQSQEIAAADSVKVKIDQDLLQQLADSNKNRIKPQLFEEQQIPEQLTKSEFWENRQKKSFYLSNVTKMLTNKFGLQFETINDDSQRWSGKYSAGKIILNEAFIFPDTPFHEVMHPYIIAVKNDNVALYNDLVNDLLSSAEGQSELERIKSLYPELSAVEQTDEALVTVLGRMLADRTTEPKSVVRRFLDWLQTTLANLGIYVKEFTPVSTLSEMADLVMNPSFVFDLQNKVNSENTAEYYSKIDDELTFNNIINDIVRKLRADVNIPSKNESDRTRKYFSSVQLDLLEKNKKDLEGLDNFVRTALTQTKIITERFEEFRSEYENKKNKSADDIQRMSNLLYEMETNIVLYSDLRPLLRSMKEVFPDDSGNYGNLFNYLNRQDDLINGYKNYGLEVVSEWLMPYAQKGIKNAVATGKRNLIVSDQTYNDVRKKMNENGITDNDVVLREAVKQEIKNTLLIAKDDADFFTTWLSGVTNTKDSISSLVGIAVVEEMQKAFKRAGTVREKIVKAVRQYRGNVAFATPQAEETFYKRFLREADSWEYAGLNKDGTEKYDYVKRWAFHEEFLMDKFYNAKRDFMTNLGPAPSRENEVEFKRWKDARDKWMKDNTEPYMVDGKEQARPKRALYGNPEFAGLMNDPYFNLLYTTYKASNEKLGSQGLKYGIIPQVSKGKNLFTTTVRAAKKLTKKDGAGAIDELRSLIGDQEQLYYAENIEGFERKTVPINYVNLLEVEDLSFNLADTVSRLATSSYKFEAMKAIEPQILVMKNFIGGNAYLKIDKRKALQSSAKGVHKLIRGSRELLPVEAKKRNDMLMGFINDVVYGEEDDRQVIQGWGARFVVYDKNDTSNNGKPMKRVIKNFEDLKQLLNRPDLNYSDFKVGQEVEMGDHVVKLNNKDVSLSLNKVGNNTGLITALQNMAFNVNSLVANVGIGNIQSAVESAGGKHFTIKDWGKAQTEYTKALLSGSFLQDMKGDKQSKISQMLSHYDGIMGDFQDELGKQITPGIANKLFRRDHLFLLQKSGEHQIQSTGMIAMMYGQKVKTNSGQQISLWDAWEKGPDNNYKLRDDVIWTSAEDDSFRNALQGINKELNGNFSKLDKAKLQRVWWGRALMMFRKHIYNGFKSRYSKEQVNYEQGTVTEGYYRTFMNFLTDELSTYILNKKFRPLTDQEKYAVRKLSADLGIIMSLFVLFKATDDDDDDNEFNDLVALWSRRLVSDTAQYAPVVGWLELSKVVRDPSASVNTIEKYYKAIQQLATDPDAVYTRSGPGYTEGELKWKAQMAKLIPVYRQFVNLQQPENLLEFYKLNVNSLIDSKKKDSESAESENDEQ